MGRRFGTIYDAQGQLAAEYGAAPTQTTLGRQYLMSDYLGTTRVVTDASGNAVERKDYTPFGEEVSVTGCQLGSGSLWSPRCAVQGYVGETWLRQKFTGKERGFWADGSEFGLDYFGARYFSAAQGRFTSADEFVGGVGGAFEVGKPRRTVPGPLPYADITNPQSLNKYVYALNNPLRYVDPDGHEVALIGGDQDKDEERNRIVANASAKGEAGLFKTVTDKSGKTTLILDKDKAAQFKGEHSAGYNWLTGAIAARPTISVQFSAGGDNVTSARDAAGNVTVNLDRSVSSTDIYLPLRGYSGEKIPNPFNIIAGHEVLGHAYPKIMGWPSDEQTARQVENVLRQEQRLPLRDPNSN